MLKSRSIDVSSEQTSNAFVCRAALRLELIGLSAGCVTAHTPSQVICSSPEGGLKECSCVCKAAERTCSASTPLLNSWGTPAVLHRKQELSVLWLWTFWLFYVKLLPFLIGRSVMVRTNTSVYFICPCTWSKSLQGEFSLISPDMAKRTGGCDSSGIPNIPTISGVKFHFGKILTVTAQTTKANTTALKAWS